MTAGSTTSVESATVPGMVDSAIEHNAERVALVDGPSGASVEYRELGRRVACIAAGLQRLGLEPGDRVAVWAPNVPPVAAVTLAAMRIGCAVVPLSPALTEHEACQIVTDAGVSTVVAGGSLSGTATRLGSSHVVSLSDQSIGVVRLGELLDARPQGPDVEIDPEGVALICMSSGTTGLPKGVELTHRQLVSACRQMVQVMATDAHDVTLAAAPWVHILGMTAELLVPLASGATVVTLPRVDADGLLSLLERHRVTYVAVPPPLANLLAHHPAAADRDLDALELIGVGGAPLHPDVQAALAERLPRCVVGQGWGLTETSGALCIPNRRESTLPGTVGAPLPDTRIRCVDLATGRPLSAGGVGELQARAPQVMRGYLDRPDETAAAFTGDGWLHTGDLGHVDAVGNVTIVDRIKELIKVNAYQVAPAEVEAVLVNHRSIIDAAVVGRSDTKTGETPVAYIVARDRVDLADVAAWCAERLAPYKRPTEFELVDEIPRTASGKLLRREIGRGIDDSVRRT